MKTINDFQPIVSRIKYKQDYWFHLGMDSATIYLQVQCFDANGQPQHGRKWRLSAHMTDSEVVQTALAAVLAFEEHEAREAFRYRGLAIFSPHWNVDRLAEFIQQDPTAVEDSR